MRSVITLAAVLVLLVQTAVGQLERKREVGSAAAQELPAVLSDEMRKYLDLSTFDLIKNQILADAAPFIAVFKASVKAIKPVAVRVTKRARAVAQGFCGDMLRSLGRILIYSGNKVLSVSDSLRGLGTRNDSNKSDRKHDNGDVSSSSKARPDRGGDEDPLDYNQEEDDSALGSDALPAAIEAEIFKVLYSGDGHLGVEEGDVIEL